MVHKEPLLVQASDLEVVDSSGYPLALHPYSAKLYSHQGTVNFSSKKNGPASWKRKTKKAKVDLSTTTVALYLLRYNMALQIAATAIVINLLLSVATFYFGLNSLYCAFGMDCVIGTITSCILVWRFASAKTKHIKAETADGQHLLLLDSNSSSNSEVKVTSSLHDYLEASCRSGLLPSNTADTSNISVDSINTKEDQNRELWSTFWLGQVMIFSGAGIVVRTAIEVICHVVEASKTSGLYDHHQTDFAFEKELQKELLLAPTSMEPLFTLALISLALNLLLMSAKMFVYLFLRSNSMLIEGVNSLISALFAAVAALSIRYASSIAYLDQTVSILFGVFLIAYGGYNVLVTVGETVFQCAVGRKGAKDQRDTYQMIV